ncbi:MAG: pyridoxamine 5'-phosphate oxidase [Bacteroidetes bacterium SW_9_63_38]|nr:MAG: pyridoxamine 5'-phosphate oxidase [Bacteroidetes bacterium SW_9_63_38]
MNRLTSLDEVRERVWRRLSKAADKPGHPLRLLTFGTVAADTPQLRTVVLREAVPAARRLAFHSDRRSQKIEHIRTNNRASWLGWDPETGEQVRLRGAATVHRDDEGADAMWREEAPRSLDVYRRTAVPGTPLDAPDDALPAAVKDAPITRADVAEGRTHFAVVRTIIDEIGWLHLHADGHYRARFTYDADAAAFEGTWIVP